jgi:hypothetical protein
MGFYEDETCEYAANVLKTVQECVRGRRKAGREICMPVYSL